MIIIHVYIYTDSLCSLHVRMHSVGIIVNYGGDCSSVSDFSDIRCRDFLNEFSIQCNQAPCSPRVYNLSACIIEARLTTTDTRNQTLVNQCSNDMNVNTDTISDELPQAHTPTTVCRYDIANRTVTTTVTVTATYQPQSLEPQGVSCMPSPTSSIIPTSTTSTINVSSGRCSSSLFLCYYLQQSQQLWYGLAGS